MLLLFFLVVFGYDCVKFECLACDKKCVEFVFFACV